MERDSTADLLGLIAEERAHRQQALHVFSQDLNLMKREWSEAKLTLRRLEEHQRLAQEVAGVNQRGAVPVPHDRLESIEAKLQALLGIALERELELAAEKAARPAHGTASSTNETTR